MLYCRYSLEVPRRGASNEYPQHMFSWRNKTDISIFSDEKKCPICCYDLAMEILMVMEITLMQQMLENNMKCINALSVCLTSMKYK